TRFSRDWSSDVCSSDLDAAPHSGEADVRELIDQLLRQSPVFAHWWTRHTVVDRQGGVRDFQHPSEGRLSYQQITFRLATRPDCKIGRASCRERGEEAGE